MLTAGLSNACFYDPTGSYAITTVESTSDAASSRSTDVGSTNASSASTTSLEPTTLDATTTQESTAPECGDGQLDPGEQCDDGNLVDGDGCQLGCTKTPECGDGELAPGEQCDDGNAVDGDGCEQNCTKSILCGDGFVDPGEGCDDGNADDNDACLTSCVPATCGDAQLWARVEACDDGPQNGAYGACAPNCGGPGERCGDGVTNGPEECDDADAIDDDDCSNACVAPRLVFTTKASYYGDLGGLDGADAKCADRALSAGLPGAGWRAWLSDGVDSPSSRFDVEFAGHYQLVDGTNVAYGWGGLTSGSLLHALDLDEEGQPLAMNQDNAWTSTSPDGYPSSTEHCNAWTSKSNSGTYGITSASDSEWTGLAWYAASCMNALPLYCFQDPGS